MTDEPLNPAQDLLADLAADLNDVHSILIPGSSAELAEETAMLHPAAEIHCIPTDYRSALAPTANVVAYDNVHGMPIDAGSIDLVMIEATGDRDLTRRWLALTRQLARPNGVLLVAGANDAGIKSAIGDAREAIGPSLVEDYRRRNRVAHIAIPPVMHTGPEWLREPGIAPGTWGRFTVQEAGIDLVFETLPGVFSAGALDAGTRLLLDHLNVPAGASVLDVGCGVGVIGVVAGRRGAASVTMTDVNLLAIASTNRNAALTDAPVDVVAGDVYGGVRGRRFDLIVSNPPFHHGKIVDYDMPQRLIVEAKDHLNPNGRLVIVANAFLPYDRHMREQFNNVEIVASTRQYRVLQGQLG